MALLTLKYPNHGNTINRKTRTGNERTSGTS